MSKILTTLTVVCLLVTGCVKSGTAEFVTLVQNHRELTLETNQALIKSIIDEVQERRNDKEAVAALEDLIDRLRVGARQSELIDEYVRSTQVNSDVISEMVRQRWSKK